ncbi:MAG: efflux RND transporter periplasmic adaptor subunit [Gammaproteobacteria bacterium]|nr:efflux RND transporter periplasmic adaptor subunit [Gammaproteobacteria bacterium]
MDMVNARSLNTILIIFITSLMLSACTDTTDEQKKPSREARVHLVAVTNSVLKTLSTPSTRTGTLTVLRKVKIFNQEEGEITSNRFYPGDTFKKNDVLINIDGSLLKAQLDKAVATREQAKQDMKRIRSLVKKRLAAEDEKARTATALKVAIAEEALLRTRLRYTTINAPFDGTVSERLIEPGDIAPRYTHLITVIDRQSIVVRVKVSELLITSLKQGGPATIKIDALGNKKYNGVIKRIYPTINPNTRLGIIEVAFEKIPDAARVGSLTRVTLSPPAKPYLVVPFTAIRRDNQGEYVYIIKNQLATKNYVRTGVRHGNLISISDGLKENTAVITKGFLGLREGKKVATGQPPGNKPDR